MEILNQDLQNQLIGLLQVLIGGVLSIGSIYAVILINKYTNIAKEKLQSIKDENAKHKLEVACERLNSLLVTNITNTENSLKQELLNASADGKLTKEELLSLKESVVDKTLKQLGPDTTELLTNEVSDIRDYTETKLEEVLANLKLDPNSSVK